MNGVLADLVAGERSVALGILVEVPVEDVHLVVAAGNVFLEHQVGLLGILHQPVVLDEFVPIAHDEHLLPGPGEQPVAMDALEHHRIGGAIRKLLHLGQ